MSVVSLSSGIVSGYYATLAVSFGKKYEMAKLQMIVGTAIAKIAFTH